MQKISKKRNYKLTRNTARISTGSVWPNYLLAGIFFISIGFACTYYYVDGGKSIKFLLKINALEQYNTKQEKELLQLKLELQMSQISYEQISKGLKEVKEENTSLKESILFYEKVVGKRK
mgnify:FL=1|tara:strand:+ start:99 stop:458 length:360 start_codon:yes stop_codon:yes gene_type:complete